VTPRPDPAGPLHASPVGVVLLLLAALVAACGAATASPSPSAPPQASTGLGGSGSASGGSGADGAGRTLKPGATPWPGNIVEAVILLEKADLEIQAAGADLGAAAAYQDLKAMWGAADGLATLVARLQTIVPRIAGYPETAAAAKAYDAALPDLLAGAGTLRDAITAGDGAGVTTGSEQLASGLEKYALARRLIGPLSDQALLMQRILVK
jgi:hypothetical protein